MEQKKTKTHSVDIFVVSTLFLTTDTELNWLPRTSWRTWYVLMNIHTRRLISSDTGDKLCIQIALYLASVHTSSIPGMFLSETLSCCRSKCHRKHVPFHSIQQCGCILAHRILSMPSTVYALVHRINRGHTSHVDLLSGTTCRNKRFESHHFQPLLPNTGHVCQSKDHKNGVPAHTNLVSGHTHLRNMPYK